MNHDLLQARIIHLSDTHFGGKHRFSPSIPPDGHVPPARGIPSLSESVIQDLSSDDFAEAIWRADATHPIPLLLAVTGDLTQRADAKEFEQATTCIKDFLRRPILGTCLTKADVSTVPGNHDVIFEEADAGRRWYPYCDFHEEISGVRVRPAEAHKLTRIVDRSQTDGMILAEINSCFDVRRNSPEENRGHVDQGAIDDMKRKLRAISPDHRTRSLKIALLHHHPIVLPSLAEPERGYDAVVNSKLLLAVLREFEFHLILHGHKHYPHTFSYDVQCAWTGESLHPLTIVSGGSAGAYAAGLPSTPGATNTYNLIALKWNHREKHGRVRIVTRGLVTHDDKRQELSAPEWRWQTMKIDDRVISSRSPWHTPVATKMRPFQSAVDRQFENSRIEKYARLRGNMLVAEVFPSLEPGQGYEVRAWLVEHIGRSRNMPREVPKKVEWCAGEAFPGVVVCGQDASPAFPAQFSYWGGMIVQARLYFADGVIETDSIYARIPGT